jgi:RimJ/RimL family protein N-acetyltransferase
MRLLLLLLQGLKMSIEILDAKQSDIDYIMENPIHDATKDTWSGMKLNGLAKTAVIDGEIIGTGGIAIYWEGVAGCWLLLSKHAEKYPVKMVLAIRNVLEQLSKENNIRRLDTECRTDFPKAQKLVEALGFEYEGLKRGYLPDGTDALMYGKLRS